MTAALEAALAATPPDFSRAAAWMRRLVDLHGAGAHAVLEGILFRMTPTELAALQHHWPMWGRQKQIMPRDSWRVLLLLAGRGWGKTRAVNEYIQAEVMAGNITRFLLIGETDDKAEKVIVRGKDSGLLAIAPPWFKPRAYKGDPKYIAYPNGAIGYLASAERPDSVRGENLDFAFWDEFAVPRPELATDVLYNVRMALRGSENARLLMATTSRKRRPILREIRDKALADPKHYRIVKGRTLENRALPRSFLEDLVNEYWGTPLWQQELEGEILDEESDGAIFKSTWFIRMKALPLGVSLTKRIVAVDPAVSNRRGSDQTGISGGGLGDDGRVYVLADRSDRYDADAWPREAVKLAKEIGAQQIIVETNRGGDLAVKAIADELSKQGLTHIGVLGVFAHDAKETRADPVARLYAQLKVVHVGDLMLLEEQQLTWDPLKEKSPDRIDALVWMVFHLAANAQLMSSTALPALGDRLDPFASGGRVAQVVHEPDAVGEGWNDDLGGRFL
jgi:phage terminase large subunit-like protein